MSSRYGLSLCHKDILNIQNVIIERKTLNDSRHKPYFMFMSCHGYEGVMSVLCTPLQVKCYPVKLFSPFTKSIFTKSSTNIKPQYPNVNGCKI